MVSYLDQDQIVLPSLQTQGSLSPGLNLHLLLLCCLPLPLFAPPHIPQKYILHSTHFVLITVSRKYQEAYGF